MASGILRAWAIAAAVGALSCATASAQVQGTPLAITSAPVIAGDAVVGSTLQATGGAWQSPAPSRTTTSWAWWRCPGTDPSAGCEPVSDAESYVVVAADRDHYLYLYRTVDRGGDRAGPVSAVSEPTARVTDAPAATPTPGATPAPTPTFDTAAPAATPVPTRGAVLEETSKPRRVIRPFPTVRMKGAVTTTGARVTLLSVKAPRTAKITLRCTGAGCPVQRWSRTAAQRKSTLTRIRRFERSLRAGVRLTISITRSGHVGKRTTLTIRRGAAPSRSDRCLSAAGRVTTCPAGV